MNSETGEIKAVVFDHGGVLTRGGESGTNEKAASALMGLDYVLDIPYLNRALKIGQITNQEYVDRINQLVPDAPYQLTMAMWDNIYDVLERDPQAYRLADRIRQTGREVAMLSSVNKEIAERLLADGSYGGFYPRVLSCYVGCAKPDLEIYALVEGALRDVLPHQILFLDDQEKCCAGARARGWEAIRVDSTEQMTADVSARLGWT